MKSSPSRGSTAAVLAFVVVLVLGACAPAQPGAQQQSQTGPEGSIVIAAPQEFLFIDPNVGKYSTDSNVHAALFDSLVDLDKDMRPQPSAAESIKSISPTVWQFKLRKDIKFTNGEALNAESVKFTVERVKRSINPQYPQPHPDYAGIVGAEVVDEFTVNITTTAPDPFLLGRLVRMYLVPPKYIAQIGESTFNEKPVGSGPYTFVERVKDSHVKLTANVAYWGGAPKIKDVTFRILPQASTRVSALRAGEVDIVPNLPPDEFDATNKLDCCTAIGRPSVRSPFVWIYPESPQGGGDSLKDRRVRQALNYAVNKDNIVRFVLGGHARIVSTVPALSAYGYDKDLAPYPYDPEKAKRLLAEAGVPNGFTVNFEAPVSGITIKPLEVAQAIAADLAKVGVKVNFKQMEFAAYVQEKDKKAVPPLFLWSWGGADYVDVDPYLRGTLYSKSRFSLTNRPDLDALIDASVATVDPEKRLAPLKALQRHVHEEAYFIFLYNQEDLFGVSKRIASWTPTADEIVHVETITLKK